MYRHSLRPTLLGFLAFSIVLTGPTNSDSHWCSNIFVTYSRLIVKPAQTTINLTSGSSTTLRVYIQNNFPYKLVNTQMRGTASGYTITSAPTDLQLFPGQKASFVLTITPTSGPTGTVQASTMGIQVRFRTGGSNVSGGQGGSGGWMDDTNANMVKETFTKSQVEGNANHYQSGSLNVALFGDTWPSDSLSHSTFFGRTGIRQLIKMFGYRFCWNSTNDWRCLSQDCPSPCAEGSPWAGGDDRFEKNCMRAGVDLAVRKPVLGADLTAARDGALNALKGWLTSSSTCTNSPADCPINQYKCLAAVVGAYLWQGASSTTSFTNELNAVANKVPAICKNAAQRILGGGTSSTCATGKWWEQAACAAAEGIANNTGPVTNVLMPRAGDGYSWSGAGMPTTSGMESLYYAAMLHLAASHHKNTNNTIPFYPDAGTSGCTTSGQCNDSNPCTTDTCSSGACQNTPISGCCTTNAQCADTDPCTADTCVSNACQHAPIASCCTANSQCADTNPCTADTCVNNACQNAPIAGCCTASSQCNDNNACTTDTCVSNACQNAPISGCCTTNSQCNDNNACTTDTCVSNACQNAPISGCCTANSQCADTNPCTADTCVSNACQNTAISGCCTTNSQCNDNNACTTDTCVSNACQHQPISGCCTSDTMCADNDPCTVDKCNTATGICSNTKTAGCCTFDTDCDDSDPCTLDKCNTTSHTCSNTYTCIDAGPTVDAGAVDAGAVDAGAVEAGAKDAGVADSGGNTHDSSVQPDRGSSSGANPNGLEGGCAISASREPARSPLLLVLILVVVAIVRRRR